MCTCISFGIAVRRKTISHRISSVSVIPYSGTFSRAQIFANHRQTCQEKNFAIFIFATKVTISDHTPYNFLHVNGDLQHVFQHQNDSKTLACLSKRVGHCQQNLPCQREGADSEIYLWLHVVMTGELS